MRINLSILKENLIKVGYIPTDQILYTVRNAMILDRPILVEGKPGVGKSSLAKALSESLKLELLRVQCYEGITSEDILYTYDYPRQLLYTNAIKDTINKNISGLSIKEALLKITQDIDFYGPEFLIERPVLKAINGDKRKVLLIDEIDKCSEEIEYLLLEVLSDYSMSIPELGKTIVSEEDCRPIVLLTSNRTRELSEALKRRCLYLFIDTQPVEEIAKIIKMKAGSSEDFSKEVAENVAQIQGMRLKQKPSVSEAILWARCLKETLGEDAFKDGNKKEIVKTLGVLLKNEKDVRNVEEVMEFSKN